MRLPRFVILLFAFGLLAGPGVSVVAAEVERGRAEAGAFALLLAALTLVCRPLLSEAEAAVFGLGPRPWLGGRLRRWQRLALPYSSALYVTQGLTWAFGGAVYLITAPAAWSAFHVVAIAFNMAGGALLWFGMGRLVAGVIVIHWSGHWAAPMWAWRTGIALIALSSILGSLWALWNTMQVSAAL